VSFAPTASPDIGLLLDGRYRVEELVARGGMATVYRGHDERLDRTVALKIMHPHLAADPEFLARFTREARSAARLSHPCVVSVFDQGEDADRVYLAMELIEGETLRAELSRTGALTVREVLRISIAVAQALQAAHRAGIIHRDIKPENILLAEDGRVKVADFGLARAIGSATSSTSATLLGTVAYISPEVVTRGQSDERSDLYSFGVVLYEMLTGVQPHTGELPVHVAFQHVHEDMPAPSLRTPSVPRQLDSLVTWCCARTPASRPRDAYELLEALEDLAATLPAAVLDAPPLAAERNGTQDVPHLTSALDDAALLEDAPARSFPAEAAPDPLAEDPDASTRVVALRPPSPRRGRHLRRGASRSPLAVRAIAALAVLALLAGGVWASVRWYATEGPGGDRAVPSVVGASLSEAESALEARDLAVRTSETYSDDVPAGHVVTVTPNAGSELKRGDAVTLLVSRGQQTFTVPDVRGASLDDARASVEAVGLTLVEDDPAYDATVPEGSVVSQSSQSDTLPEGGEVHVVVSRGPEPVAVPDQSGRSSADAQAALKAQGFRVRVTESFSPTVATGAVISQDPPGGTARPGATIGIVVSKGPEMVTVPDVFQRPEAEATSTLEGAGFTVKVVHDKGDPVFGLVYEQSSAGGSQAAKGSTITIKVF